LLIESKYSLTSIENNYVTNLRINSQFVDFESKLKLKLEFLQIKIKMKNKISKLALMEAASHLVFSTRWNTADSRSNVDEGRKIAAPYFL
jgi:hypothetical protein